MHFITFKSSGLISTPYSHPISSEFLLRGALFTAAGDWFIAAGDGFDAADDILQGSSNNTCHLGTKHSIEAIKQSKSI